MIYFFYVCSPLQDMVASVRYSCIGKGINMTFNNLIEIIVEIREIALLNRATPGSSLVYP